MPRFFMTGASLGRGVAIVSGADANHIKVLRMKIGDKIVICDGEGNDHHCRIANIKNGEVETEILKTEKNPGEASIKCTILAGLPKGERADFIVQKCTEMGASEIIFFMSERCVARIDEKSLPKKIARFSRIAEEAAKQSGRGIIPEISARGTFAEALDIAMKSDLKLFMYETGERKTMKTAIEAAPDAKTAAIITGPEGGFEPFEAEIAAKLGFDICSMGSRILRCETAPMAALSAIMYHSGNL